VQLLLYVGESGEPQQVAFERTFGSLTAFPECPRLESPSIDGTFPGCSFSHSSSFLEGIQTIYYGLQVKDVHIFPISLRASGFALVRLVKTRNPLS
jgi:hypothetical protein